jgi:hypothetical protein
MPEKFEKGARVIVRGENGIPDRPAIVQSHVAMSVYVQYTDKGDPPSHWRGQSRIRPADVTAPVVSAPARPQASLFD